MTHASPMTAAEATIYLESRISPEIRREIDFLIDAADPDDDPDYGFIDAWRTLTGRVDDGDCYPPEFVREFRGLEIAVGVYREITREEMRNTSVSRGKKYDLKLYGKFFVFDRHVLNPSREGADS